MTKKFKFFSLVLLSVPSLLQAAGVGLYIPHTFSKTSTITDKPYNSDEQVLEIKYNPQLGIGFVIDTNVGKNELLNYRLGLEYQNEFVDTIDGKECTSDCSTQRVNMVHTFGFGIVRNDKVRIWLGPRINIAHNTDSGDFGYKDSAYEFAVAPALGINFNFGKLVSLGMDVDYRVGVVNGKYQYNNSQYDGEYKGNVSGFTGRLSLIFRFNEVTKQAKREQKKPPNKFNKRAYEKAL